MWMAAKPQMNEKHRRRADSVVAFNALSSMSDAGYACMHQAHTSDTEATLSCFTRKHLVLQQHRSAPAPHMPCRDGLLVSFIRSIRPLILSVYVGLSVLAMVVGYATHPMLLTATAEIFSIKPSVGSAGQIPMVCHADCNNAAAPQAVLFDCISLHRGGCNGRAVTLGLCCHLPEPG